MNAVLSLFLVALVAVQTQAEETDFKCPLPRGSYRHQEDCNALYFCVDNVPELKHCASGLRYNRLTENCDWPAATQCITGPFTDTDFYEVASNPIDDSNLYEGSDIRCPDTDCNCNIVGPPCSPIYYKCIGGRPYKQKCSPGLVFDPETSLCNFPKNVKECPKSTPKPPRTTTKRPTTTTKAPTTTTKRPTTTTKAPTTTTKAPTTTTKAPTTTTKAPTTTNAPTTTTCSPPECEPGIYPHPDCCDKYIQCENGIMVVKQCDDGLKFNPETKTCDWAENVNCPNRTTTTAPTTTTPAPTPDPPIGNCSCSCCMIPDLSDCSKFLLCEEKKLYIKSCPEGLVFNPASENCDYSWNVANPVCKKTIDDSYGKAALYTQIHKPDAPICQLEFGLFPDSTNCGRFYHCVNWRPYSKLCPQGLHWNAIGNTCDSPCSAKCDEKVQC